MKKLAFLGILLVVSNATLLGQQVQEIDSLFTVLNQQRGFSGNILIAEKGKVIYEKSFGYSNYEDKSPLTSQHMFNVASVSKTITAVAVMQLVERGLLQLNDEISQFLGPFPYEDICLGHLLTHTSGLPKVQTQPFRKEISGKGYSNKELLDVYTQVALKPYFAPGTKYNYANTNYIFLGLIIEKVSGLPFDHYLRKYIFEPAGMDHTFLFKRGIPKRLQQNVVSYYRKPKWLSNRFHLVDTLSANRDDQATFDQVYGASSIHTTTGDLLKFHTALQNGELLSESTRKQMYAPIALGGKKEYTLNAASNYPALLSAGWRVAKDSTAGKIVFHSGGFQGGRSFFIRNLQKDQCIILLTNNIETDRYTFTAPMRMLNGLPYQLDRISLPRVVANAYLSKGISAAVKQYHQHERDDAYIPFVDFDFEEIGAELMETGDAQAAIEIFKLYTAKFPDEYAWGLLGDAHLMSGNTSKALDCFKKSVSINPDYEHSLKAIRKIEGTQGK